MSGRPNCTGHGLPAKIYTSRTQEHPGREFYKCPNPIGPEQCKYFLWVDEYVPPSGSQTNALPPTPRSARPRGPSQTNLEPPPTPTPAKTLKRNFSAVEEHGHGEGPLGYSQASQKRTRLQDIEDALADSHPSSQTMNSREAGLQSGLSTDIKGRQKQISRDSFEDGRERTWPPQTPPRLQKPLNLGSSALTPSPSPMVIRGRQQVVAPSINAKSSSQGTAPDDGELTADSIADMIHRLGNLPEYVRKLEKKKVAAEKSRDAKATKIIYLEKEVERLKVREKELEDLIALYEQD